jgi:hypothetical protein
MMLAGSTIALQYEVKNFRPWKKPGGKTLNHRTEIITHGIRRINFRVDKVQFR